MLRVMVGSTAVTVRGEPESRSSLRVIFRVLPLSLADDVRLSIVWAREWWRRWERGG